MFNIGDKVLIARNGKHFLETEKWDNSWVSPEMDNCVGKEGIIDNISTADQEAYVVGEDLDLEQGCEGWWFPFYSLDKVE